MAAEDVDIGEVREPLSSFAVIVIYVFMLIFTMFRAFTDNNDKDEDFINCTCRGEDHSFYTTIIVLFSVIWGIIVIFWFVVRTISWFIAWCNGDLEDEDKSLYKIIVTFSLEPFSFLAHLAVLPLLFLQFLSTYAWICLIGDRYCREGVSSNQLQIDRSGVLLGFFIAAAVIGFTSRMTSATK